MKSKSASASMWDTVKGGYGANTSELGFMSGDDYRNDPRHMGFVFSRYKFVSKMLEGRERVIEVGCGDGFYAPVVGRRVSYLICTDIDGPQLSENRERLRREGNIFWNEHDFCLAAMDPKASATYALDVIEHIVSGECENFVANVAKSLVPSGVFIVGTPNQTASKYASPNSVRAHVNLQTGESLRDMLARSFENVFLFGMNDEVVHTGFTAMSHYLLGLCVTPRK